MKKLNITPEWLYNEYINNKKNIRYIADELGVSRQCIIRYVKKFNIPKRTQSEENLLVLSNHINLSNVAKEFIYGELLGDGHLDNNPHSSSINYSTKHKKYLVWLSKQLDNFGIIQSGKINKRTNGVFKGNSFRYRSKYYVELKNIRKYFYPYNIKIVPEDLQLTPLMVKQWYIGDGSLIKIWNKKYKKYYYSLFLHTNGFTKEESETLSNKLNVMINIKSKVVRHYIGKNNKLAKRNEYWHIRIPGTYVKNFLDYIGKCPKEIENIYGYKWNFNKLSVDF